MNDIFAQNTPREHRMTEKTLKSIPENLDKDQELQSESFESDNFSSVKLCKRPTKDNELIQKLLKGQHEVFKQYNSHKRIFLKPCASPTKYEFSTTTSFLTSML